MKRILIAAALLFSSGFIFGGVHLLRFSATGGYDLVNKAGSGEMKIAMAYPVTPKTHIINTEISIVSGYSRHFIDEFISRVSFGFGIRLFLNAFDGVRPYFTHEILSGIITKPGAKDNAKTFSVLLGLGADFPVSETSSVFFDLSYVFYDTDYFGIKGDSVKTLGLSAGYVLGF